MKSIITDQQNYAMLKLASLPVLNKIPLVYAVVEDYSYDILVQSITLKEYRQLQVSWSGTGSTSTVSRLVKKYHLYVPREVLAYKTNQHRN